MNLTQTVDIPASHRLTIDVPREVPTGPVILTFTPPPVQKPMPEESDSFLRLRGCCKGGSRTVEDFLADCRADKERELAIERRQEEERKKRAELHS